MRVVPVLPNAKKAAIEWAQFQHRDPTPDEVARWDREFPCPPYNRAMLCGNASGIDVIDVDDSGMDSLRGQILPRTRTVLTPSGGWHFYYRHGGCDSLVPMLPGVELRSNRTYALIPPSVINGIAYEVAVDEPIVPLPEWIVKLAAQREVGPAKRTPPDGYVRLLRGVEEGERNIVATRLVGWLIAHGLGPEEVYELLVGWNLKNRPPMPTSEVRQCVESVTSTNLHNRARALRGVEV